MKPRHLALALAVLAATLTLTAAASEGHHRPRGEERGEDHHGRDRAEPREEDRGGERREGGRGRGAGRASADPTYLKECGACHLAYPPDLLPAASWRTMLAGLDRHFGQNAELDDATRGRLEAWLVTRAGDDRGGGAPQRITRLGWFQEEHRKVGAAVVARPAVGSLANCAACHLGAASWEFDEDRVRIPR